MAPATPAPGSGKAVKVGAAGGSGGSGGSSIGGKVCKSKGKGTQLSEAAAQALQEYKERMVMRQKRGMAMDTQSVAARKRRAVISQGVKKLQAVIPGGQNLDTARVLDRSVEYVVFLERQLLRLSEEKGTAILEEFEAAHRDMDEAEEGFKGGAASDAEDGLDF